MANRHKKPNALMNFFNEKAQFCKQHLTFSNRLPLEN